MFILFCGLLFQVGNLFHHKRATVMSVINGSYDASAFIPLIIKVRNKKMSSFNVSTISFVYGIITILKFFKTFLQRKFNEYFNSPWNLESWRVIRIMCAVCVHTLNLIYNLQKVIQHVWYGIKTDTMTNDILQQQTQNTRITSGKLLAVG